jgi:tetratricopeptide (TPR) repeat protein
MLRASSSLVIVLLFGAAGASAQMMPDTSMTIGPRSMAPGGDDLILTLPDRDNPPRRVNCGEGSYEQIISDCSEVLSVPSLDQRKRASAFLNRGTARYWLRQYPDAAADYDRALALDPRNLPALLGRGMANRQMHEYDRAVADFDAAVALKPDLMELYMQRAAVLSEKGEDAKALKDINSVLSEAPDNPTARLNNSILLYRLMLAAAGQLPPHPASN